MGIQCAVNPRHPILNAKSSALSLMFTKVRQVRAFESIIQQVETAILQGSLTAGDRLPSERELQEMLEVSRNTLRESLRVL
jgi:GntR family transcriptional repressor for pyruvate dehydrogenase complex